MAQFTLLHSAGQRIPIEGKLTLGRGRGADYSFDDPQISRRHATLYLSGDGLMVRDENSANGTFINDQRIETPTQLKPGDQLKLGETSFTIEGEARTPTKATYVPSSAKESESKGRRRRLPLVAAGCGLLGLCLLAALATGLLLPATGVGQQISSLLGRGQEYDLEAALMDEAVDDRPELLAYLGQPDAFTISRVVVEGVPLRVESWRYYGFGLRVDFVDGEITWTIDLEPVPEGTIMPAWYNPMDFELGMPTAAVSSLMEQSSPAAFTPELLDASGAGEDLAETDLLAGDQIVVGLDQGGVVYVETIALFPEQEGG